MLEAPKNKFSHQLFVGRATFFSSSSPKISPGIEIGGRSIARKPSVSGSSIDRGWAMADHAAPSIGTTGLPLWDGTLGFISLASCLGRIGSTVVVGLVLLRLNMIIPVATRAAVTATMRANFTFQDE